MIINSDSNYYGKIGSPISLGTYADGTILFVSAYYKKTSIDEFRSPNKRGLFGSITKLHLLYTNGNFETFNISCGCDEILDIRPLNPNYILLLTKDFNDTEYTKLKIMDWTGNSICNRKLNKQFQKMGASMKDESRFFVTGVNQTSLLYAEYIKNDDERIINGSVYNNITTE